MEKYLIVKGCAGLGNRLYTLSNAINYARKTNRTLIVDWKDGQFSEENTNAFNYFFKLKGVKHINDINQIKDKESKSIYPTVWNNILDTNLYDNFEQDSLSIFSFIPARASKLFPRLSMTHGYFRHKKNKNKSSLFNFINKNNFIQSQYLPKNIKEDIIVFVDFSPKYYKNIIRENIQLTKDVQKKINDFVIKNNLNQNSIAVHIRYTDKKPDATFEKLYKSIEMLNPNDKTIFLSTDNLAIQKMFINKYHSVVTTTKYLPEESKEGLHQWALYNNKEDKKKKMFEESIIDMWLLSKCEHLIYQKNSSFSQISRILKNDINCTPW